MEFQDPLWQTPDSPWIHGTAPSLFKDDEMQAKPPARRVLKHETYVQYTALTPVCM